MSLSKRFPLLILASVCWSLECLISALTEGAVVVTFLGSLAQSCCGERGTLQRNITGLCASPGSAHSDSAALGSPRSLPVWFRGLHCSGSRSLFRELSVAGPGLRALPRSKPLRFRFSGSPQRRRFGWACVLCPSQVRAAQVTKCLAKAVAPSWRPRLIASPSQHSFSGCTTGRAFPSVPVSLLGS